MSHGRSRLLRVFGAAFGVAVAIGSTIGAGILRTPGQIAEYLPSPILFLGVWLAGGAYALLGATALAELGAALPKAGGQTVFVRRALGDYAGFVVGWSDWISTCAATALIALVIAEYTGLLLPAAKAALTATALAVVLAFAALHFAGVRAAGRTQIVTSSLKALAFAALIIACFVLAGPREPGFGTSSQLPLLTAMVLSLQAVIYTYDGWTGPIYFSEEVRDPGRDIPRAMIAGVLAITAVYLLTNAAFLYVLPMHELAGEPLAAAAAARRIFGTTGETVVRLLTIVAMLSAINALTLMAPRVLYALGEQRLPILRRVDPRGTPAFALLASTAAALVLIGSGTLPFMLALTAFFFVTNYTLSFLAVFVLRAREPELPRPYRAWGYPWSTAVVLIGSAAFLVATAVGDTRNSLIAAALLAASWPVFRLLRASRSAPSQSE